MRIIPILQRNKPPSVPVLLVLLCRVVLEFTNAIFLCASARPACSRTTPFLMTSAWTRLHARQKDLRQRRGKSDRGPTTGELSELRWIGRRFCNIIVLHYFMSTVEGLGVLHCGLQPTGNSVASPSQPFETVVAHFFSSNRRGVWALRVRALVVTNRLWSAPQIQTLRPELSRCGLTRITV